MGIVCPKCGHENVYDAVNCSSCGAVLQSKEKMTNQQTPDNRTMLKGIIYLRKYTIIGFISLFVGIVLDLVLLQTISYTYLVGSLGTAFGGTSLNGRSLSGILAYTEIIAAIALILSLVGVYMLFRGFDILKSIRQEFSIGKTGAILELFASVLLVIGIIALLAVIIPLVNLSNSSSTFTASQSTLNTLIGLLVFVVLAAIIAFVGVIMVLVALYRVGSHFNNSLVKVGAILTLFLGIIGTILLFFGFNEIIKELKSS